ADGVHHVWRLDHARDFRFQALVLLVDLVLIARRVNVENDEQGGYRPAHNGELHATSRHHSRPPQSQTRPRSYKHVGAATAGASGMEGDGPGCAARSVLHRWQTCSAVTMPQVWQRVGRGAIMMLPP